MKTPLHSRCARWCTGVVLTTLTAVLLLPVPKAAAATTNIYWDPVSGNGQIDAGSGTWDTSTSNTVWATSTTPASNTYWTSGTSIQAVFGGASAAPGAYVIDVASAIQAQIVRFTSSGYVLKAAGTNTISLGYGVTTTGPQLGGISLATGVTAAIGDGITVVSGTGGSQPLTLWGAGTLTISSSSASAPAVVKAGSNNNTNVGNGITVVVGTNGVLQSALLSNGGSGNGSLVVGYDGNDATLKVDGGTVNFANLVLGNSTAAGLTVMTVESGTVATALSTGIVRFGPSSGTTTTGTSILNLNGGLLSIGGFAVGTGGSAVYSVNFNGGTVKATQSTTAFLPVSSQVAANVLAGGAVIDTNGYNLTIAHGLASGTANDGGLIKKGDGALTLTGTNTYTGATKVQAGTVALGATGNISDSLILGVSGGTTATLDVSLKGATYTQANISGNGTITGAAGSIITATGTVTPGFSVGELNVSTNFTLGGASTTQMEIAGLGGVAGTDFDFIQVGGTLTYGGALSITGYNGFDLTQAGSYDLFDFTSASGDFSSVNVNGVALSLAGSTWSSTNGMYSFDESSGILSVSLVPEPATYAMLLGGLGILGMLRRKFRA